MKIERRVLLRLWEIPNCVWLVTQSFVKGPCGFRKKRRGGGVVMQRKHKTKKTKELSSAFKQSALYV